MKPYHEILKYIDLRLNSLKEMDRKDFPVDMVISVTGKVYELEMLREWLESTEESKK